MRLADLVFAFPTIILAMVITAALGPNLTNAVIAMLIVSWPAYARVTRSLVVSARQQEYVVAGRLLGAGAFTSLRRDVLPNVLSPVFVLAMLDVGTAILLLSGLSFLGLGAVPPAPDWGAMVAGGVEQFSSWWIAAFPGLNLAAQTALALRAQFDLKAAGNLMLIPPYESLSAGPDGHPKSPTCGHLKLLHLN